MKTWRRASVAVDIAAIALGGAIQVYYRQQPGERLPRGAVRTAGWWISATGLAGALVGLTQEVVGRRRDIEDRSIPVALPVGIVLAAANEFRRRRWEADDAEADIDEDSSTSALKSLGMGLGVTVALNIAAVGGAPVRGGREQGPCEGAGQLRARVPARRSCGSALRHRDGALRDASAGGPQDRARCRDPGGGVCRSSDDVFRERRPRQPGGMGHAQPAGPSQRVDRAHPARSKT